MNCAAISVRSGTLLRLSRFVPAILKVVRCTVPLADGNYIVCIMAAQPVGFSVP